MDNKTLLAKIYHKNFLTRYIEFIVGIFLVAVSYNVFTMKCNLVYGVGGIGLMVNKIMGISPSIIILGANLVLLVISYIFLGKESTKNTILGSLLYPLFIEATSPLVNISLGNLEPILIVLCASVLSGFGLGLVFKAGYTTGGTDILNQLFSRYGKMSIGKAMYFTDLIIILFSVVVFDFPTLIYSLINLYIISLMTDKVILGISESKAFYIITEHETAIKKFITQNLSHGVTVLEARGGYTGNVEKVIMCIVPTKEYYMFKEGIHLIDKNAFFIVTDAYEVSGAK